MTKIWQYFCKLNTYHAVNCDLCICKTFDHIRHYKCAEEIPMRLGVHFICASAEAVERQLLLPLYGSMHLNLTSVPVLLCGVLFFSLFCR